MGQSYPQHLTHRRYTRETHKRRRAVHISESPRLELSIPRRVSNPERHYAVPGLLDLGRIMRHTQPFAQDSHRCANAREWRRWLNDNPLPVLVEQWDTEFARSYGAARRGELSCAELRRICKARRQVLNMLLHDAVPRPSARDLKTLFAH